MKQKDLNFLHPLERRKTDDEVTKDDILAQLRFNKTGNPDGDILGFWDDRQRSKTMYEN